VAARIVVDPSLPGAVAEPTARVHAILRRAPVHADVLCFADAVLDVVRNEVHRAAVELDLTATEFRLLRFLLEHPRRTLSRAQISTASGRRSADVGRTSSRRTCATSAGSSRRRGPPVIRTVRQVGYVLDDPGS
jgi:two-component system OmpR family response regulator